ncbi:5363_t:CDS:2 [Ambispora gerdemannii]|uniref:5363_t:CDS:1 n=1 Tax=Ambispora gerdemannii TaxID=144530 RepID=A0A9N9FF53_9GLOM|nr:5363_t:CDS:2 [Ambispora gerdemannii]
MLIGNKLPANLRSCLTTIIIKNNSVVEYRLPIDYSRLLISETKSRQSPNTSARIRQVLQIDDINQKLLFEGVEIDENSIDDFKKFLVRFIISNNTKTNAIHFEIIKERIFIEVDIRSLKPNAELNSAVQDALSSPTPICELRLVFEKYGHFVPIKLVMGDKLQQNIKTYEKFAEKDIVTKNYEGFSENEITSILHSSVVYAVNGDPLDISQIPSWFEKTSNKERVIKRVVVPIIKILDHEQQLKIEDLFTKENRVLMKNKTLLMDTSKSYYRFFFDKPLKSYNYQIFGKLVSLEGSDIDVKFNLKSESGFSVNWDKKRKIKGSIELEWMLIGCPSEIGYYDSKTRDISVKTGFVELKLEPRNEIKNKNGSKSWSKRIDVGISLSQHHAISIDVEFASASNKMMFFQSSCSVIFRSVVEVRIETYEVETLELIEKDKEFFLNIRWCVVTG